MPRVRSLAFMIWAGLSAIWIVAGSIFVLSTWENSTRAVRETYKQRERQCVARYAEADARERCLLIMDLERFQSRSIAMFNRGLLVLGPPLVGFVVVAYLQRRRRPAKTRKR
jgi:hypothetical protein